MELETNHFNDWANDAFAALSHDNVHQAPEKWQAFGDTPSFPQPTFTLPPSLLSQGSVERYGQVTPPEELSPAEPYNDFARESSIPVDQLRNEALFPDHQVQALQDYQPQENRSPTPEVREPATKRRKTTRQSSAHQAPANPAPIQPQQDSPNPQPPKRKRGRPKSTPQLVEAYTADGYQVQVSSTRQSHLEKNRVAAHKCRQRKKEYINGLEGRARVFSQTNKALRENVAMLREEVLQLKNEVLRHAGCGFWAVDEYLARCAGDLLGVEAPESQKPRRTHSPAVPPMKTESGTPSADSLPSSLALDLSDHDDDLDTFDMLNDFDDDDDVKT